ncbi:hypothetical protein ACHAPO_010858 [Fusarium lateritium]
MTPKTISVIGGLDADLIMIASRIPDPGESVLASHYQEVLGGKGANSAIAAFRTCHDKVSQKENYLDLETTSAGYPAGQPSTAATEKESNTDSDEENIEVKMIGANVVETMLETAGNAGIDLCLNAAPASPINRRLHRHVTHLLMNESEVAIMSGRDRNEVNQDTWLTIAREFLNRGVANVVITIGAKGAFYANAEGSGHCPAYDVKVEDTTGAGDTFTGAYASHYLRQKAKGTWDMRSSVFRANKAAAITIQSVGAQDGIPWSDEIDCFDVPEKVLSTVLSSSLSNLGSDSNA